MPKIYECQIAKSEIADLKVLDSSLVAYSTKLHGIKIFDYNECVTTKSIENKYLDSTLTTSSFSPNSELFAFVNQNSIYIIQIVTEEIIHILEIDDEEIDIISFDSSSTYIIAGSKNGRVLQYKIGQPSLLSRLCSFPCDKSDMDSKFKDNKNFVSSFAFYNNNFACSGYGGAIVIIDLDTQTNKKVHTHNKTRINALCFLDEKTLISGNCSGVVDIISLADENGYKRVNTPISNIKQIVVMPNPNYIMVTGKSNIVTIVDIKNYKIAHSKYIELDTQINKIALIDDESLVIALKSNTILTVELPGIAKLKSLIIHNSLEEAFELIEKEPMLQGTCEHEMLEEKFEKDYADATKALINQNIALATQVLEIYKNIKSKRIKIKELFTAFKNYPRFQELCLEKKYALAYAMSSKFEPLKQTMQYKKMEQEFRVAFSNAQRHILQNNLERAKTLLNEYSTVISKKPFIKLLTTQNKKFVDFLKAIQVKDFKKINKLINSNELFKQIPNYLALNNQIEDSLQKIELNINSGNIDTAQRLLKTVEEVPHISQRLGKLHTKCKNVMALQNAYENNDFKSCYKVLDLHNSLKSVELVVLLEKHWSKLMQKCEKFALEGNIKDIKNTLGELINLSSRENKIGDLIRVGFRVRIDILINEKSFEGAEAIIYTYIDIFGIDNEITKIMKKFENTSTHKLAITQTQADRPPRNSWRYSDIIMKNS